MTKKKNITKNNNWLKLFLGIFVANEDMPFAANKFVQKASTSGKVRIIWALVSFFWLILFSITSVTVLFFTDRNTLYNVNATTEIVNVYSFEDVSYPLWSFDNVKLYQDCGSHTVTLSGELKISKGVEIEFRRVDSGFLHITLQSENLDSIGVIGSKQLSDCVVFELSLSPTTSFTLPIDGIIEIGGEIKEAVSRMPILLEGRVHIADRAVLSQEYYLAEPRDLVIGDKFTIKDQTVQSSGFVFIDNNAGMKISYAGKGSTGVVERYKTENVHFKNSFWNKLYNDETVVFLWILLGVLYTTFKVIIRFCIDDEE